jgi:hypothetical protein
MDLSLDNVSPKYSPSCFLSSSIAKGRSCKGAVPKIDPTTFIIPVVTELLDFYQLFRTRGKDLVEIVQMDKLGVNFLDLSTETFKDFTVRKEGQKNISVQVRKCTE